MKQTMSKRLFKVYIPVILALTGIAIKAKQMADVYAAEKKNGLEILTLGKVDVVDFNRDLRELNVSYDNTDLKTTNQNIGIYTIRVANNGTEHIRLEDYDPDAPIGLRVLSGKIVDDPRIIFEGNRYLFQSVKLKKQGEDSITMSSVILDPGEFFTMKVLVLYNIFNEPELTAFGKVAGQKEVPVMYAADSGNATVFWKEVLDGEPLIWAARIVALFIAITFAVWIVFILVSIWWKVKRKRIVNGFKRSNGKDAALLGNGLFGSFIINGPKVVRDMHRMIASDLILHGIYVALKQAYKNTEEGEEIIEDYERPSHAIDCMLLYKIATETNGRLSINKQKKQALARFRSYVRKQRAHRYKNGSRPMDYLIQNFTPPFLRKLL